MGRDGENSAARLERLRGVLPLRGWVEELTEADELPDPARRGRLAPAPGREAGGGIEVGAAEGTRRRHVVEPMAGPAGRWRWGGVPTGAAVALLGAAVVLVLVVGRGGAGADELLVGPAAQQRAPSAPAELLPTAGGVPVEVLPPAAPAGPAAVPGAQAQAQVGGPGGPASVGPLVVHVDGAVAEPGVVVLPPGSRVSDAVSAAGGVTAEADTRLVNLARLLQDGEQVVVPRPGEDLQPAPAGADEEPGVGVPATAGGAAGGLVDLNSADLAALDSLPGIGPVLAQRILDHREQQGPFTAVGDLGAVSGIGPAVLAGIQDLVTV